MDDLATKDHVFACFLPSKDEFFEITFTEPSAGRWNRPSSQDKQRGISEDALVAFGGATACVLQEWLGRSRKDVSGGG